MSLRIYLIQNEIYHTINQSPEVVNPKFIFTFWFALLSKLRRHFWSAFKKIPVTIKGVDCSITQSIRFFYSSCVWSWTSRASRKHTEGQTIHKASSLRWAQREQNVTFVAFWVLAICVCSVLNLFTIWIGIPSYCQWQSQCWGPTGPTLLTSAAQHGDSLLLSAWGGYI